MVAAVFHGTITTDTTLKELRCMLTCVLWKWLALPFVTRFLGGQTNKDIASASCCKKTLILLFVNWYGHESLAIIVFGSGSLGNAKYSEKRKKHSWRTSVNYCLETGSKPKNILGCPVFRFSLYFFTQEMYSQLAWHSRKKGCAEKRLWLMSLSC